MIAHKRDRSISAGGGYFFSGLLAEVEIEGGLRRVLPMKFRLIYCEILMKIKRQFYGQLTLTL